MTKIKFLLSILILSFLYGCGRDTECEFPMTGFDNPAGIAIDDKGVAYIANADIDNEGNGFLSIFNLNTNTLENVGLPGFPGEVVLNEDNSRAYISFRSKEIGKEGGVAVVDVSGESPELKNPIDTRIDPLINPFWLNTSPQKDRLYVSKISSDSISVIDIKQGSKTFEQVVKTIHFPGTSQYKTNIRDCAQGLDGILYVVDAGNRELLRLDLEKEDDDDNEEKPPVSLGIYPTGIIIDTTLNLAFVVNQGSGDMTVVDLESWKILDFNHDIDDTQNFSIVENCRPYGLILDEDHNRLLVIDKENENIYLINLLNLYAFKIFSKINKVSISGFLEIAPKTSDLFFQEGDVTLIPLRSDINYSKCPGVPNGIAIFNDKAYITNYLSNSISVINLPL